MNDFRFDSRMETSPITNMPTLYLSCEYRKVSEVTVSPEQLDEKGMVELHTLLQKDVERSIWENLFANTGDIYEVKCSLEEVELVLKGLQGERFQQATYYNSNVNPDSSRDLTKIDNLIGKITNKVIQLRREQK